MSFSAEAEVATRDIYARLLGAWNARDAGGFAALFAEDGVSIGFDGSQVTGEEIRDQIGGIFSDHPTAPTSPRSAGRRSRLARAAVEHAVVLHHVGQGLRADRR